LIRDKCFESNNDLNIYPRIWIETENQMIRLDDIFTHLIFDPLRAHKELVKRLQISEREVSHS
jgi:hypothetical protein